MSARTGQPQLPVSATGQEEERAPGVHEEDGFKSPPRAMNVVESYTPSDHPSYSNATSLNNNQQGYAPPLHSNTRRDQKTNSKFTARMNRTLQQQEAAAQHISSSARQSSQKRQGVAQMGLRDSQLNSNEMQMLPPSLSPAPRSHAELLTSNNKSAVSMITPTTQQQQQPNATDSRLPMKQNNHGRSPLQNLEASVTGMASQLKRPNQTLQAQQEQFSYRDQLQQQQAINNLESSIANDDLMVDGDFRETPRSLFGRKAGHQLGQVNHSGADNTEMLHEKNLQHQQEQQQKNNNNSAINEMGDPTGENKKLGFKRNKINDQHNNLQQYRHEKNSNVLTLSNQESIDARIADIQTRDANREEQQHQHLSSGQQQHMLLLPNQRGSMEQNDVNSASAGKPQTPSGINNYGQSQLHRGMLTPNQGNRKGNSGHQQTQNSFSSQKNMLYEQVQRSDSSAMKLQENPTAHLTSQTSSNHQSAFSGAQQNMGQSQQHQGPVCSEFEEVKIPIEMKNQDSYNQSLSSAALINSSHENTESKQHNGSTSQPAVAVKQVSNPAQVNKVSAKSVSGAYMNKNNRSKAAGDKQNEAGLQLENVPQKLTEHRPASNLVTQNYLKAGQAMQQDRGLTNSVSRENEQESPLKAPSIKSASNPKVKGSQTRGEQVQSISQLHSRFLVPYQHHSVEGTSTPSKRAPTTLTEQQVRDFQNSLRNPNVQSIVQETTRFNNDSSIIRVSPQLPVIPVPQPFMVTNSPSYKPCHCRRTGCFKLYCDCLRAGLLCSDKCKCTGCKNRVPNEQREKLLNLVRAKVDFSSPSPHNGSSLTPTRGCHCKKSGCLKNYCECFQNGQPCSTRCSCSGCKNNNMSYILGRKYSRDSSVHSHSSSENQTPGKQPATPNKPEKVSDGQTVQDQINGQTLGQIKQPSSHAVNQDRTNRTANIESPLQQVRNSQRLSPSKQLHMQTMAGYTANKMSQDEDSNSQQYQTPVKMAFHQGTARALGLATDHNSIHGNQPLRQNEVSPAMLNMNKSISKRQDKIKAIVQQNVQERQGGEGDASASQVEHHHQQEGMTMLQDHDSFNSNQRDFRGPSSSAGDAIVTELSAQKLLFSDSEAGLMRDPAHQGPSQAIGFESLGGNLADFEAVVAGRNENHQDLREEILPTQTQGLLKGMTALLTPLSGHNLKPQNKWQQKPQLSQIQSKAADAPAIGNDNTQTDEPSFSAQMASQETSQIARQQPVKEQTTTSRVTNTKTSKGQTKKGGASQAKKSQVRTRAQKCKKSDKAESKQEKQ